MRMAAQYELLKELLNSGTKLSFGQDFFFKFYQPFLSLFSVFLSVFCRHIARYAFLKNR